MIDVVRIERAAFAMFRICDWSRHGRLVTAIRTLRGTRFSEVVMLYSVSALAVNTRSFSAPRQISKRLNRPIMLLHCVDYQVAPPILLPGRLAAVEQRRRPVESSGTGSCRLRTEGLHQQQDSVRRLP